MSPAAKASPTRNVGAVFAWMRITDANRSKYLTKTLRRGKVGASLPQAKDPVEEATEIEEKPSKPAIARTAFDEKQFNARQSEEILQEGDTTDSEKSNIGLGTLSIAFLGAAGGAVAIGESFQLAAGLGISAVCFLKVFDYVWHSID